jgi:hypothetical protein
MAENAKENLKFQAFYENSYIRLDLEISPP